MSDTYQDKRIRLVSLTHTVSGAPRPAQDIDFVLLLAAQRKAKIYIKVPEGDVAFADRNYSAESRPSPTQVRMFSVNSRQFAEYIDKGARITYSKDDSPETFLHGTIHPEVTYLALGTWHAEALRAVQHAQLDTFPSGLTAHPDPRLARHDWLLPRHFGSALRLCSTERSAGKRVTSTLGMTGSMHRELSDSPERIEPKDILIDELLAATLGVPQADHNDDPYRLRTKAPAVYLLYRAAAYYYELLKSDSKKLGDVKRWIAGEVPGLYQKTTITNHAVKLINPGHRRGSGKDKDEQIEIDPAIIASEEYHFICARSRFITESLALLFYVARWWIAECDEFAEGRRKQKPSRLDVEKALERAGFYSKERVALRRVVMWPDT